MSTRIACAMVSVRPISIPVGVNPGPRGYGLPLGPFGHLVLKETRDDTAELWADGKLIGRRDLDCCSWQFNYGEGFDTAPEARFWEGYELIPEQVVGEA